MKKNLLFLLLTVILFSCSDKENIKEIVKTKDYAIVGELHNEGLDFIFEEIKLKKLKTKSDADINSFIKEKSVIFTLNNFEAEGLMEIVDLVDNCRTRTKSMNDELGLTQLQKTYLNELYLHLKDSLNYKTKILNLEKEIINNCTAEEADMLLCATSVARYSAEYWQENYEKWENEFGTVTTKSRGWGWFWNTISGMAKADAGGALIGAIGGAARAVAGGCYGSVIEGIMSF